MLRQLDYQERVLTTLDAYVDELKSSKTKSDAVAKVAAENPTIEISIPDFSAEAWKAMKTAGKLPASRANIEHSQRLDGIGRPVPNAVLKVPTGGGKTFLAVNGVSRILGRYLERNTGFVLWIVPNEAIYTQTLKNLKNRQHPYRHTLDKSSAGRVKILEKADRLDARDVENHLCVMLLMLQSANRESKETLKIFQDRGDVHGFVPAEGDQLAQQKALEQTPNLDAYKNDDFAFDAFTQIKDSLGNALRLIRPIVVMDEGHKAISELAFKTLYGFNPCFVLELTATPKDVKAKGGSKPVSARPANVLVEVTGLELDREGMIKMPINLDPRQGTDWKATLQVALDRLEALHSDAKDLRAEQGRYIRPLMLVQVERTGKDQRDSGFIHSEDVKERLLALGYDEAEIAIKTAEKNDLNQPENLDLMSPTNRVRVIITKSALQEGWDCPFAYVLCALAANSNLKAMTQLIGRILRQPEAQKTGIEALDECHVITHHASTKAVVKQVEDSLKGIGLGDLVLKLPQGESTKDMQATRTLHRRGIFKKTAIYLPKVMFNDGSAVRDLDYETDVLAHIDWLSFDASPLAQKIPEKAGAVENQLQRISLADEGENLITNETISASNETFGFDPAYATRVVSDIVPNPFIGRAIIQQLIDALTKRGFDDEKLGEQATLIVEVLRDGLLKAQTDLAETNFRKQVKDGAIQFKLRTDGQNWKMPQTTQTLTTEGARQLHNQAGQALQKSVFAPVFEDDLNGEEQNVAIQLDGDKALVWWHRNVVRSGYSLQGWKKAKMYPDFVFAVSKGDKLKRIAVLETKGDQLEGNLDTTYKRNLMDLMSNNFDWDNTIDAGSLEVTTKGEHDVVCKLVLMSDVKTDLPSLMDAS